MNNTVHNYRDTLIQAGKYVNEGLINEKGICIGTQKSLNVNSYAELRYCEELHQKFKNSPNYRDTHSNGRGDQYAKMLERMRKKCGKP